MTPADVIAMLSEPDRLMRKVNLVIAGGPPQTVMSTAQAQVARFRVEMKMVAGTETAMTISGFTGGIAGALGRMKQRPIVKIVFQSSPPPTSPRQPDEFDAFYVPMTSRDVFLTGASYCSLPTGMGPGVMITSQLSGCTFSVGTPAATGQVVSHLQPGSEGNREVRLANLRARAATSVPDAIGRIETGRSYDGYASVIGIRVGSRWRFYMQGYNHAAITHVKVI
ncbi:hypothetical protein [Roseococcus sp. YIM B11640]|uniref:hypothetical protein n=1 Tax=Roseococcus sp. YIM B11640 TaxID=3133973 RepID=UPI003C798DA3